MHETVLPHPKGRGLKKNGLRNRTTILFLNKNEIAVSFFVSKPRILGCKIARNDTIHPLAKANGFLAIFAY